MYEYACNEHVPTDAATGVVGADLTLHPRRHNNVGDVTAGQARYNSSNVGGVTAGQVAHNSSKPNCRPTTFPRSWQVHHKHQFHNTPIIFPSYMFKPPQSCLSCFFLSKPSHTHCSLMYSFLILSILVTLG